MPHMKRKSRFQQQGGQFERLWDERARVYASLIALGMQIREYIHEIVY
jgi:hypothetical protein